MTTSTMKERNKTAGAQWMEKIKTWNDAPVVTVKDNDVDLALKLLRKRMHNAEIFKQLKLRRKNLPNLRQRRDRGKRIQEKKNRL